jgi:SNF2 family DNA or RNA helicase
MRALQNNRITFVSLDQASNKKKNAVDEFKKNKDITVFLLHAERER